MKAAAVLFAACALATVELCKASDAAVPLSAELEPPDVVLTPTRLRQPIADVPASVSVIRGETLARYGIFTIPDALRLVPGMAVSQPSGGDYRIGYHGTNILTPRRMNVLIDGVSVYQPAFARVDWRALPVSIEDVDRIEVTRGPNSAAYGPNSMLAIVNIITKHPKDVERGFAAVSYGSQDAGRVFGRFNATVGAATTLRLSAAAEQDSGYDVVDRVGVDHDDTKLQRLNFRSDIRLNSQTTLQFDAAYVKVEADVPFVDVYQTTYPDARVRDGYLSATLKHSVTPNHELQLHAYQWSNQVRQEWTTCPPATLLLPEMFELWRANPAYAAEVIAGRVPSGGSAADDALAAAALAAIAQLGTGALTPTCTTPNQTLAETRQDIEVQDTYAFSDRWRLVAGVGARRQVGDSETFLGGAVANHIWRVFGNLEAKPHSLVTLNAAAYFERDALSGNNLSSRLGANFRLSDEHSVRIAWSTGARTPDILEQRADWTYTSTTADPPLNGETAVRFFQSARSPGDLRNERIRSFELGYVGSVAALGLTADVKLFDDHLTRLISEKLQVAGFAPTNWNAVRLSGLEFQLGWTPSPDWTTFLNYAYLHNHNATTDFERTQYDRHSGSVGVSHKIGDTWRWSIAYYGSSGDGLDQSAYGRTDMTVSKAFTADTRRLVASLVLRSLDQKTSTNFLDFGSPAQASFENRTQVFAHLQAAF
jgi:iron complex outermembrane recepter protein